MVICKYNSVFYHRKYNNKKFSINVSICHCNQSEGADTHAHKKACFLAYAKNHCTLQLFTFPSNRHACFKQTLCTLWLAHKQPIFRCAKSMPPFTYAPDSRYTKKSKYVLLFYEHDICSKPCPHMLLHTSSNWSVIMYVCNTNDMLLCFY